MSAPGFYEDRAAAQPVIDRHQALMWEVGDLMHQWEAAAVRRPSSPRPPSASQNCNRITFLLSSARHPDPLSVRLHAVFRDRRPLSRGTPFAPSSCGQSRTDARHDQTRSRTARAGRAVVDTAPARRRAAIGARTIGSSGTSSAACATASSPCAATARVALMNDEAYRIFALARRPEDIGRPFTEVLRERPDAVRALAGAFEMSHLPNRAELRLKDIDRVIGYTLSQVKDDHGEADRRGDVLQGSDAGRAARGARAAARPARVAGRDGGRHRARAEESARRHRSHGRAAAAAGAGLEGRPVAARRHHERGEAGERDRRRDARVRAADPAAGGAHRPGRRAAPGDHAGGNEGARAAISR